MTSYCSQTSDEPAPPEPTCQGPRPKAQSASSKQSFSHPRSSCFPWNQKCILAKAKTGGKGKENGKRKGKRKRKREGRRARAGEWRDVIFWPLLLPFHPHVGPYRTDERAPVRPPGPATPPRPHLPSLHLTPFSRVCATVSTPKGDSAWQKEAKRGKPRMNRVRLRIRKHPPIGRTRDDRIIKARDRGNGRSHEM